MNHILLCDPGRLFCERLVPELVARGFHVEVSLAIPNGFKSGRLYVTDLSSATRLLSPPRESRATVLVVTDRIDADVLRETVDVGASGLASTHSDTAELVTAIEKLFTGFPYFDPRLLRAALPGHCGISDVEAQRLASRLTGREWDVLEHLVRGASTEEMSHRFGVTHATVRSHVHNILHKLGVHSRIEAASFALAHHLHPPEV